MLCIILSYSISAKNIATAAAGANESDVELAPAAMDIEAPIQATGDAESIMVVVTPKREFCKAKIEYAQPMQETTPSGNDELVA